MLVHGMKTAAAAGALVLGLTFGALAQDSGSPDATTAPNATEDSASSPNPSESTAGTATEQLTCTDQTFSSAESMMGAMTDTTRRSAIEAEIAAARQHMANNEGSQCAERLQGAMDMMQQ